MKKLTYVNPEIEYAVIDNDILTDSFNAGENGGDDGIEIPME